jgi:hypothetical protein
VSENRSTQVARGIVQGLVDAGVEHVVLCPGSRSAPLAYALHAAEQEGRLSVHVRIDERSAAFTALGIGMGAGPAAVVTTSGTAVANLLPAVWEARHGLVPLVVVTADRPRRLRETWANQTTPLQAGAFDQATLLSLDLQASDEGVDWPGVVGRLVARASGRDDAGAYDWRFGPVHLDVGFDDPLVPDGLAWVPTTPPPDDLDEDLDDPADLVGTGPGRSGGDATDEDAAEQDPTEEDAAEGPPGNTEPTDPTSLTPTTWTRSTSWTPPTCPTARAACCSCGRDGAPWWSPGTARGSRPASWRTPARSRSWPSRPRSWARAARRSRPTATSSTCRASGPTSSGSSSSAARRSPGPSPGSSPGPMSRSSTSPCPVRAGRAGSTAGSPA